MIVYQNKDGEYLKPGGFTRLNGGKRLSRSQLGLLKLKKVKVKEITMENGKKFFIPDRTWHYSIHSYIYNRCFIKKTEVTKWRSKAKRLKWLELSDN